MIEARELRIGNWYKWYAEGKYYEYRVKDIDFCNGNIVNFEPIPLTEEWLVRFGFTKHKFSYLWGFGNFLYDERLKLWTWYGIQLHDYLIQYVHQLQNIHFALTGQELKLIDK